MPTSAQIKSMDKVRAHRDRLRKLGLRPIQIWIPDTRSRVFIKEARRQSLAIAAGAGERDDQRFVDSITDWKP